MRRSLGRYELTHELGRGGMGVVWAAYDRQQGREVALKVLSNPGYGSELSTTERRFLREARLTGRLNHTGIPAVYDHGSHDGELFLVMERVPGKALDSVLKEEGTLGIERAAGVARKIADVLAYAHGQGVVHRDLKPSNVMVTPADGIKVLDFGVAAALEPRPGETRFTAANATPGTVIYMAPEQAVGKTEPASDLYSLGCLLYELLAGRPPFTDGSPFMLYHQHAHEPVPPLSSHRPGIPAGLKRLVESLLEKEPHNRPASAGEVRALLEAWAPARSASRPAHPGLAEAAARRRAGRPAQALDDFHALLALTGLEPLDVLAARTGAALCVADLGRTREALEELRHVLAGQSGLLSAADPIVLDTRYEIAVLLVRTGDRGAASELLRELALQESALNAGDDRHGRSSGLLRRLSRMT
ncbi:serine/threonine-protein kinase [Streptomyces cyaneofuscatus]|uniref:non-specific serine/threonine protein kinase n=1 Tax=Streptomyces cyaneofuscatus TaxID=66883 RepID=A0ABZ1ERX9_9ACTN|nr:serine/threonine-protein kinase [Streptomyces cyaneofuscatus]WSB06824.1 serine/threonine-protein kinase [Streptomyces cyaneofuscatus]WSD49641.1 serine/threonine-protein kinase [Streptomyces cyaneofuscatus]